MRALITRPAEDAQEIADALRARGFEVVIEPMLEIVPLDAPAPDLFDVQALLFTSVNGVRAFTRRAIRRDLPVFAVGNATAAAARAAGFGSVHSAGGDTGDLARLVRARLQPDAGALLHVSGSAVAGDLADALGKDGFRLRREMLYEARPAAALSPALLQQLKSRDIDLVLFFSPRTARTFVSLMRDAGLYASLDRAIAICLSHAVAAALAGMPLRAVRVAARPELAALLAEIGSPGGDVIEPRKEQALLTTATPRRRGRAVWLAVLVLALALIYATAPHWRGALPAEWQARLDPYLPGSSGGAGALEAEIAQLKATGAAREGALGALIFALNRRVDGLEQSLKSAQPPAAQTGQTAGPDPALGQRLDSLERTLTELQNRPVAAQSATPDPALGQRLESLERAVAALRAAPPGAAAGAPQQATELIDLRALEARVVGLEARPATPDLRPLIDRIAVLEARPAGPDSAASSPDFVRLAGRLAMVETAVAEAARRRDSAQSQRPPAAAFVLAVTQLREAMRRAAPYAGELGAVKALAGDDPQAAEPIKALEPRAERGIPTEDSLIARFEPVTLNIVRADRAPAAANVADRALSRLTELVSVRRIGDTDAATTDGILARAETRLRGRDLAGAADAVAQLQGPAAAAAAEWLADARARLAADGALSRLTNAGVARLAAGSTPSDRSAVEPANPPRQAGE